MASDSHTRLQDSLSSEATGSTPSTSRKTSLTTPTVPRSLSRTPPPSPSPFMLAFNASEPPMHKHIHHIHTASSSSSQFLNRSYTTLRRIWREHRHIRRFLLSLLCILLPTLLTAAYFVGAYWGGRGVAMKDPLSLPPNDPILRHNPIGVSAEQEQEQEQEQGRGQGWSGNLHGGGLKRRGGIVPRQASSSSIDNADVPVLSLGGLGNTQSSSASSTSSLLTNSDSLSATPTTTLPSTIAPSVPSSPILPTPFVQPFDATLSTDFLSASCQTYFTNLTQSLDFRQCRPFSLLLPTSQAFLSAQTNLTLLTAIIYGTCTTTPSEDECVQRMDALGNDLRTACSDELGAGYATAWDALNGMKNYKMMRDAACLRNLRTNAYCFVDAAAATSPSDIYFYQLPLGTPLPGTTSADPASPTSSTSSNTTSSSGSAKFAKRSIDWTTGGVSKDGITVTPTCSACTQSIMGIYASYATNSSLLISQTYGSAQKAVDATCGSGYASAISAAAATLVRPVFGVGGVVMALLMALMALVITVDP